MKKLLQKLLQRLFGKKPTKQELLAKQFPATPTESTDSEYLAKKKLGEVIPDFDPSNPDPELIEFAETFSQTYKNLSVGDYYSDKKTYHIRYMKTIESAIGLEIETFMRVSNLSGIIEFSQKKLFSYKEKMTPDFVFYQIIWAVIERQKKDCFKSDEIAIKYYLTTNRSTKNIFIGYAEMSGRSNMEFNKKRSEKLMEEFIKIIKDKTFS